jgi:hypothetical protein
VNLLIVGGLLIFALVAILGAVLLALSEQRAINATTSTTAPAGVAPTTAVPQSKIPAPSLEVRSSRQNLPVPSQTTSPIAMEEQNVLALNGQFHEFAAEVRSLHAEAVQLEQRLGVLAEMVDHIERTRNGHVSIQEELPL